MVFVVCVCVCVFNPLWLTPPVPRADALERELPLLYRESHDLGRLIERFRTDALQYQKQKAGVVRDYGTLRDAVERAMGAPKPPRTHSPGVSYTVLRCS